MITCWYLVTVVLSCAVPFSLLYDQSVVIAFELTYPLVWVFVFKRETAYEMRISDWSSDVCSSDLMGYSYIPHVPGWHEIIANLDTVPVVALALGQIGRASCRERVCQYV